jgi:hypothetical protein
MLPEDAAMAVTHAETVGGRLTPEGKLELDSPLHMGPGRVRVTVEPVPVGGASPEVEFPDIPWHEPFWRRMKAIWDGQAARGHVSNAEESVAELRRMDAEDEDRMRKTERLHAEAARLRYERSPRGD